MMLKRVLLTAAMSLAVVGVSVSDELKSYELGVRDTAVFIEKAGRTSIPDPGFWAVLDATDLSFPRVILLMRFIEAKGYEPAYLWKAGRDYIVIGSFARKKDAEKAVEELEGYGIRGAYVETVKSAVERRLYKPRLVSPARICKYPEYRGADGIRRLLEQAKSLARDVADPAFDRNAFVADIELMLEKLKDYEEYRKRRSAGSVPIGDDEDSLIQRAIDWGKSK